MEYYRQYYNVEAVLHISRPAVTGQRGNAALTLAINARRARAHQSAPPSPSKHALNALRRRPRHRPRSRSPSRSTRPPRLPCSRARSPALIKVRCPRRRPERVAVAPSPLSSSRYSQPSRSRSFSLGTPAAPSPSLRAPGHG